MTKQIPNDTPEGVVVHRYKIPAKGIRKKILYHFSDVHLTEADALSDAAEQQKAAKGKSDWAGTRKLLAEQHGEPCTPAQQKTSPQHLATLLQMAETGDAFIMAGDICDYVCGANLRVLDAELKKVSVPYLAVCGNHEIPAEIPDDCLYTPAKQPIQTLDLGDLLIFGVDNSTRQITEAQNEQLLAALSAGKPLLIVMHVPIMTEGNAEQLQECGEYFQLNYPEAPAETLRFIEIIRENAARIVAVCAGHLHFLNESEIVPGLTQYVSSQGILGNINVYEIGE